MKRTDKSGVSTLEIAPAAEAIPSPSESANRESEPSATSDSERLQQELLAARKVIRELTFREERLLADVAAIRQEHAEHISRFAELQEHNAKLANLYAASHQLQGTLGRQRVLDAIYEVIVNLIGSEDFGVYELDGEVLSLVCSAGSAHAREATPGDDASALWRTIHSGKMILRGSDGLGPVVSVPLEVDGEINGAIVISSLLEHKAELEPLDLELLALLGTHAATALYCTALQQRVSRLKAMV